MARAYVVILLLADPSPVMHTHPARAPLPLTLPLAVLRAHPHSLPAVPVTPLCTSRPWAKAPEAPRACHLTAASATALRPRRARPRALGLAPRAQRLAVLPLCPAATFAATLANAASSALLCAGFSEQQNEQEKKR